MMVTAFRQTDNTVLARVCLTEGHFSGELEYAFYLLNNAKRVATRWYTKSCEAVFRLDDVPDPDRLEVTGFVREVADPEKKAFKRTPVVRRD
jgi:hypothetical protein